MLFAAVNLARTARRSRARAAGGQRSLPRRVQGAADLAARDGAEWDDLTPEEQLGYYAGARLAEADTD